MRRLSLGAALAAVLAACACQTEVPLDPFPPPDPDPPVLVSLEPDAVQAGAAVRLRGRNFHLEAERNVVLFGSFRGRVSSASEGTLVVQVPDCLPTRGYQVTVSVGSATSPGQTLQVQAAAAGSALTLAVGESRTVVVEDGAECLRLAGKAAYLLVVQSAGTVGGGLHPFSLQGMGGGAPQPGGSAPELAVTRPRLSARMDLRAASRERLGRLEEEALRRARSAAGGPERAGSRPARTGPPEVGEERRFQVLDAAGRFEDVHAVARLVSDRLVFFEDLETPAALTDAELEALADDFDDPVFPLVTGLFGEVSDIDGNGRVLVLLTPAVNRLTPPEAAGFVGGFFFGLDLLPSLENSNRGEVLYALVPDPEGRVGPPFPREKVLESLPAILAHELQHMVHFNERMLVREAARNEAVWISEALAQTAETLVGEALVLRGRPSDAALYLEPTRGRVRDFLSDPGPVSLIIGQGAGTLAERGAGWLFLRYLGGHHGGSELLGQMTRSTRTGLENLEAVTGRGWKEAFSDWSVATFTDGLPQVRDARLHYPDMDLRGALSPDGAYALEPRIVAPEFEARGARISASSDYFLVAANDEEPVAVRLAADSGGAPSPEARFLLRVVRIE